MKYLLPLLLILVLPACTRIHCWDSEHCTRLCDDGTPANVEPPYCPINARDLLPPSNDNVGVKADKKNNKPDKKDN
ncbi:hypothetical protein [Paremcibacter congregatus]|uniref:Uncharacterized protein n=1 Tax=Paremcibacter congregatus TaxID=2043170 RepID=A0A2G4YVR4_9PROT|nr:hypothetical protein [Paremcibacter congregatus]PHZ85536.1 hypothetical protein CRD36_02235 [Paremcibacter congregatus]QDE26494.1 hypothetical protein FIV45_04000 [Paremcibacter congregatus]